MAKAAIPQRLVRDIERTLQGRINEVRRKLAKHYEQSRAALHEIAETFGIDEAELFTLAGLPSPPGKPKPRPPKSKPAVFHGPRRVPQAGTVLPESLRA